MSAGSGRPAVSVIVAPVTGAALEPLLARWTAHPVSELIVVGRDAELRAAARAARRRLRAGLRLSVVVATGPTRLAGLLDLGARAARGTLLLFADPDVVPRAGAVRALMSRLARQPTCGIAGAKHGRRTELDEAMRDRAVDGCYLVRAELYRSVRFAARYSGRPFIDWDLCLRIGAVGYRVATAAAARVDLPAASAAETETLATGRRKFAARWITSGAVAELPAAPRRARAADLVVYTAIADGYDRLKPRPAAERTRHVAFLDPRSRQGASASGWELQPLDATGEARRATRRHKILSHVYLPDHEYSLWLDGSVTIIAPFALARLPDLYLRDTDICILRHRDRACIYSEAEVCIARKLDDPRLIGAQMERYRAAGYPADAGLAESSVILRRHTPAVARLNEAWWQELERGSVRDQLSFPVVARQLGIRYRTFPLTISEGGLFVRQAHALTR